MSYCKVIALTNQKGGVGKTTTAVNLGVGLAKQGKRVLLIDADAQANLTMALGYSRPDDLPITLSTIMQNIIDDKSFDVSQGILSHSEGVALLPSNIELSGFEVRLINAMSRERVLKTYVNEVKKNYDYVLIDCMPSLGIGSYYAKELATNSAYILNGQKYPVTFEYAGQETATVHITANDGEAIENDIIYGSVSGKKSDEDGNALGGAVIGIFKTGTEKFTTENAIQTTVTAADGSFSFEKVPYGTWVIREIESPTGFVLSEEEITVTIGAVDEVVEIEFVNYFIKGNIELTKVDKDYPDNKLIGAEFEVYADTNGDGKLDNGDKLLGTMTELDGGVYQMKELRYSASDTQ